MMQEVIKQLESKLLTIIKKKTSENYHEQIKEHFKYCLKLINPIMFEGKIQMNEFKYNIMMHLFNITNLIDYIPSIFIKQIAEISSFNTFEVNGFFNEIAKYKCRNFLTQYYKTVSVIINNKQIKKEKKETFEKIVCKNLNEKTVEWLINLFTQPHENLDNKTKVLLKAITESKFEFFEAFAQNFKDVLYRLISNQNSNKNWINKYVLKIIEKCLIKLPNIEQFFITKLCEVCHSIIDIYINNQNMKVKKLYRISMRIMYLLYNKRHEKNNKIINFFDKKFQPLFSKDIPIEFIKLIIDDFIEINFYVLNRKENLLLYYNYFYNLLLDSNNNQIKNDLYTEAIEKILKYEMQFRENEISEISFIRQILKNFKNQTKKMIDINLICKIIINCPIDIKIISLEEMTFSYFSFFSLEENINYLENLLDSIKFFVENEKISKFYENYLDLLFEHLIQKKVELNKFFEYLENLNYNNDKYFSLVLKYSSLFFRFLQENDFFIKNNDENIQLILISFLKLLAIKSTQINILDDQKIYQNLLNVFSYFIIYKLFVFQKIELNSKTILQNLPKNEEEFAIYLILFAYNLPELIFNKNSFMTNPIKIEISPLLLSNISSDSKKLLHSEFTDFGEYSSLDTETKIYLIVIYYQFISKLFITNVIFNKDKIWLNLNEKLENKVGIKNLKNEKISIINLINYMIDNIFIEYSKNSDFLSKMFNKFFDKYFQILKKSYNTIFKQKIISYDLKLLLNFACYFHKDIRQKSKKLISTYFKYFPFILNEYDVFEYYVNILGILISQSLKHYDYFIDDISINENVPLELSSEKKTLKEVYFQLYKKFEKGLQRSHMINNNNIAYNMSNYMNRYTINPILQTESMNYSVNLLQKLYNNIKKIEIPPTLKTTAYLDPEKFQNYLKTHVKKNYDKYLTLSSINDIYSPSDYTKSTKLQLRNKYIGIIEGKMNNLRKEFNNNDDICYYKIKNDIIQRISICFYENDDILKLSKNLSSILIELSAFIVFTERKDFIPTFNKNIVIDECINILTNVPFLLNNSYAFEAATFCWEWILYFNKEKIPIILRNITANLKNKSIKFYFTKDDIKSKSVIFDLENTLEDSINRAKKIYNFTNNNNNNKNNENLNEILLNSKKKNNNYKLNNKNMFENIEIINEELNEKCKEISYSEYINGQIILLKFLKECMNEFCKCDMEKLKLIFNILKMFIDLKIDKNLYRHPLYIYLHFLVFNLSIELYDIMSKRINLFNIEMKEYSEFKVLLYLFGLKYFQFDKQRRLINSKFYLNEIEQTLNNCIEYLKIDSKLKELMTKLQQKNIIKKKSKLNQVYTLVNKIKDKKNQNANDDLVLSNFKELLIYLIKNESNSLIYWNNPSNSHNSNKIDFSDEKIKLMLNTAFICSDKLSINLIQRFPWITKKYPELINKLSERIYKNKKDYYNQPLSLSILVDYILKKKYNDLSNKNIMKNLLFWKFPSLNYALKFISLNYNNMIYLHKYCIHMLEHALTKAIIFYLPQLIQSLRTNTNDQVGKFILHKCKESTMIAHQFLWALNVEEVMDPKTTKRFFPKGYNDNIKSGEICMILRFKILKNLNYIKRIFWFEENDIFTKINDVSGCFLHPEGEYSHLSLGMTKEEKTDFVRKELEKLQGKILPYIYLPTNPEYNLSNILPKSAVTLQSAKKVPFIVSFEAVEYPGPDKEFSINNMTVAQFFEREILNNNQNASLSVYKYKFEGKKNDENESNLKSNGMNFDNNIFNNNNNIINNNIFNSNLNDDDGDFELNEEETKEKNDVNLIETEQKNGLFIPIFQPKALYSKNKLKESYDSLKGGFSKSLRNSVFESLIIDEKQGINLLNLSNQNNNNNNSTIDLNNLNDCTLSDISNDEENNFTNKFNNNNQINYTNVATKSNKPKQIRMPCIFKVGDDLRQDSLALQVIQIFQEIFNENNLNLYTYPYQTISTISQRFNELGGYIEVVKDTDSRDQIGKTYETNLYEYYKYSFGQENSNEFRLARKNLIESLAAYAIISYILQIKDRHNGNILVDNAGHLIHIDFGFIFDISPGGNMKFEKAAFKLTKEMIKIMEGTESEAYSTFVDLTIRAFLACRDYMNNLLDPVYLMFSSGLDCFRNNSIKNFIDRFKLNMNEEDAANYMKDLIKNAEDNWRTNGYDLIQKVQNNIYY